MPVTRRRGFTLVELLVALALFGVVGALLVRTSLGLTRALRLLQARASAEETLDRGSNWVAIELEEVGPPDLRTLASDEVRYRALRFAGLACAVGPTSITLVLQRGATSRSPQPGRDSLLLLVDTAWRAFPVQSVTNGSCGSLSALMISTTIDSTYLRNLWTPLKIFESMQARFYPSSSAWWLGGRSESAGEGLQPLAGPFVGGAPVWSGMAGAISVRLTDSSRTDSVSRFVASRNP